MSEEAIFAIIESNYNMMEALRESNRLLLNGLEKSDRIVRRLAISGNRISAMQVYKELYDCDLRTAKEFVDSIK